MNTAQEWNTSGQDPLGLRKLPMVAPDQDGWPAIAAALRQRRIRRRRMAGGWLAAAASLVLVVWITGRLTGPAEVQHPAAQQTATASASPADTADALGSLIAMSQMLESQLRGLRDGAGPMPAESAVYVAELEDLVAQVDSELSFSPDSVNLWGQRVNLLLDLAQIYQHQWERQYGRMASL